MWLTMGPIADRTRDRLGASDLAIVEFRKQMLEAVRDVRARRAGDRHRRRDAIPPSVCSFQAIVPKTTDWRTYEVEPVWEASGAVLEPSYDV